VKRKVRLLESASTVDSCGEQLDLLDAERRANWKSSPAPRTASATALVSAKCNSGVRFATMNPGAIVTIRDLQESSAGCPILYLPLATIHERASDPRCLVFTSSATRDGSPAHFWQRVSEGRQIDDLWSQFAADARAGYGFYMKESDAEELQGHRGIRRWFRTAKILFCRC